MSTFCPFAYRSCCRDSDFIYQSPYDLFLLPYNNSKTAERIFAKFYNDILPLDSNPNSQTPISYSWCTKAMDAQVVRWECKYL